MRILQLTCVVVCAAATGCVASEESDEEVDTTSQALIAANRIAGNRIAGNKLAANRIAGNRIAGNRIAGNRIAGNRIAGNRIAGNRIAGNRIAGNRIAGNRIAGNRIAGNRIAGNRIAGNRIAAHGAADELIETEDGREVFKYVVECAIPEGITLYATDSNGVTYDFPGAIGLAPGWLEHSLTEKDSRWISACLFARVNAHDVSVLISMRGPARALDVSDEERSQWTLEEGAFYGQYFVPESEPIEWYACSGRNLQGAHDHKRDCANPDPNNPGFTYCGFTYTGECGDFAVPRDAKACRRQSGPGTFYRNCETGDDVFREVITTYVRP